MSLAMSTAEESFGFITALRPAEASRPFYFEDSQVVLQVDGQTYKIHRYFLTRESEFFKDLFSLPPPGDSASVEGSDDNPIRVPETPTMEFENLLRFFYFGMHDDYVPSLADWIAMLSISTRLIFEKVRERAIKEITARLDQVDPFELIGLAVKYDVEQWLKPAYRRIVTRSNLITHQEALKVPFPMAVMLMRSREQYWKDNGTRPHQYNYPGQAGGGGPGGTVWPRGSPDTIIDSEIRVMELASVETRPPRTESTRQPMLMSVAR
jgi:hypothetical protein